MFLSRNKKNNVYPCKPQFYYIKVGLRGSKLYRHVFVMLTNFGMAYVFNNYMMVTQCSTLVLPSNFAADVYSY